MILRRSFARVAVVYRPGIVFCLGLAGLAGCSLWETPSASTQGPDGVLPSIVTVKLVADMAVPWNMDADSIEGIGVVTCLTGTGSDPEPSAERAMLEAEMKTRGITSPSTMLASKNTSLVLLRAFVRPGAQKGDRVDVEVRIPSRSETTSLAGGYLLETRLKEMRILDSRIHDGHPLALAEGPILIDPVSTAEKNADKNHVAACKGRILGGAVMLKDRPLMLVLTPGHRSISSSARIEAAINRRFHTVDKGIQAGVAKAKTEQYVELRMHPRYKNDIERYMNVVRAVAIQETAAERADRIGQLQRQLLDFTDGTASLHAALQLEAVGHEAIAALLAGMKSENLGVRFYAAEALAYLDQHEAAECLAQIARESPPFRVFALSALGAMEDRSAYEVLCTLLDAPSAETRYGAFRALREMNAQERIVAADPEVKAFSYHVLKTAGPTMIHVTHSRYPEIVLFGADQRFRPTLAVNAGSQILVTGAGTDQISVSKFAVGEPDQKRIVTTRVDEVIRAIADLGGTYPDVVQALEEAKKADVIDSRFEVDALPEAGRVYDPVDHDASALDSKKA